MVEMARDDIKPGIRICDPACGVGKFLLEPLVTRLDMFYKITKNGIKTNITIRGFDKGFDREEQKTIILAKANMLIYFSDLIRDNPGMAKDFANLFNESFTLKTNSILGTLSDAVTEEYDLIMTNPPYVTSGSSNLKEEIKKGPAGLSNHYKINALGVEGLFMEWIIKALKPGGKAFVVVPDGMLNRQNDKNLRRYILEECFIDGLISLPLNTFFTTNKKTYILCLTKKTDKTQTQTEPVFTYLVSEIGETRDVYRFDIDQNDLNEAVSLFAFFKGNKSKYAEINIDKRCKIIPVAYFSENTDKNWVIDNLWTQEEKLALGVVEKDETLSLFDFSVILEDTVNTLHELQEEVKDLSEKNSYLTFKIYRVKDLFDIERGSGKYIKRYINKNRGEYPVYSGSAVGPFAFINSFDYDTSCLSWVIDGFAGFIMAHNEKFSATNHRGLLLPKDPAINFSYAKAKLEPLFRAHKKGRYGAAGADEYTALPPFLVEDIEIPMPVDGEGNIDATVQAEIAGKYELIAEVKAKAAEYRQKIVDMGIAIELDY